MLRNILKYSHYIFGTFWADLRYRYAGTALGFFWFILTPLLEVAIYSVVFSQIVSIRSGGSRGAAYVIYLVAGLFPFLSFSQMLNKGTNAIVTSAIYIRRSLIPIEVFVFKEILFSGFSLLLYLVFLLPVNFFAHNSVTWHLILFPLFTVLLTSLGFGMALVLANLRVLFPDLSEVIPVLTNLWRWTLPIMYSDENFPEGLKWLMRINPLYYFIRVFRDIIVDHKVPPLEAWISMILWVCIALLIGGWVTRKLRSEVKDLI